MNVHSKAWVIGSPIAHSLSPTIFQYVSHWQRRPVDYQPREVKPEGLPAFLSELRADSNALGANVTLPLKEELLSQLDDCSEEARMIGAVNVVSLQGGRLSGFNTDVIGIERTLESADCKVEDSKCLILGAGGSAKAVAYVLAAQGAKEIYFYNPRSDRGARLAEALQVSWSRRFPSTRYLSVASIDEVARTLFALVVNTTPVGMTGKAQDTSFFSLLRKLSFQARALAFDLIYTPEHTPFLQAAKSLGLQTVGGLGMLVDQALATWELWVGKLEQKETLRQRLRNYLGGILQVRRSPKPIFLTGFMGSGKSVVGTELAQLTRRPFVDTDQWIVKKSGATIAEIFARDGESAFRDLESQAIEELAATSGAVVALGGGALLRPENRDRIRTSGLLIHLAATVDSIERRLTEGGYANRPILAGTSRNELRQKIESMMNERLPLYRQATLAIQTDSLSPIEVAQSIIERLRGEPCLES